MTISCSVISEECPPWVDNGTMDEEFIKNAVDFASKHDLQLAERLGFGVHGIIHAAENKSKGGRVALKAHRQSEPYKRERDVYQRLKEARVGGLAGFHVPVFLRADDELLIIEMSIVTRPFVLDFAGAYLDQRPSFSEEIWADWESGKMEQFGERWSAVRSVLSELEELEIFLVDVSPSNVAFRG